jgi:hypothetical protein
LRSTGTSLPDLLAEMSTHVPLEHPLCRFRVDYEYIVAEGVVVVREQRNTRDEDWSPAK